jgi:hypothetical protein
MGRLSLRRNFRRSAVVSGVLLLSLVQIPQALAYEATRSAVEDPTPQLGQAAESPASAPASDSNPAGQDSGEPEDPTLDTPDDAVKVHAPRNGLELSQVERNGYRYDRRDWDDIIRNDPDLLSLHRRGKLLVPGIIFSGLGTAWLALTVAAEIDGYGPRSATGTVMTWGVAAAMLGGGIPMLLVGSRSRIELRERQRQILVAPVASRSEFGLAMVGRF